ncbi:VWA domain-containing protein [Azospirillum soli]|uniref:VWA domain-containing protein n=1 Tax=Azospirillum soli TaxID=1304799 RepID=UPI001AEB22AA|nr:VWA domain-containing protein [Azospirillum soli]MBP2312645.1 Ca-activated chloride channel family protein [Azospirillum soli]
MTDLLSALHLLRPWWLLLLVPAVVLWWLDRRTGDPLQPWRVVMDPGLLAHLTVGGERTRRLAPGTMLFLGWLLGIVAIAGPTWRREPSLFADAAPPAMIVLRVTPTMMAPDLPPTRLERARQKISDLLDQREGAATGLVAYSGSAHLVLPPTVDKDVVLTMARALSPEVMPREGDQLAPAVMLATRVLAEGKRGGSVVVLADTAAPDQVGALRASENGAGRPPTILWAMVPPGRAAQDTALQGAVAALNARLVEVTVDVADAVSIARRLESATAPAAAGQEDEARWQDAGYWLTPLIAALVLGWFRRGWRLPA